MLQTGEGYMCISLKLHPVCIQCGVLTQSSTNILSTSDEESNKGKYKKNFKKIQVKDSVCSVWIEMIL